MAGVKDLAAALSRHRFFRPLQILFSTSQLVSPGRESFKPEFLSLPQNNSHPKADALHLEQVHEQAESQVTLKSASCSQHYLAQF